MAYNIETFEERDKNSKKSMYN